MPARGGGLLGLSVGLAFCVLPNLAIPETDAACTLAAVLVVLTADHYLERPNRRRALALGGSLALGLVSKFSALLLAPAVGVTLLIAPGLRTAWRRRVGHAVLVAAVCLVAIELVYGAANWRYDAAAGREVIRTYCRNQSNSLIVGDRLAWAEGPLLALEHADSRLAQWSIGLLGLKAQDSLGIYPCYAFGTVTSHGRWWYFSVLLAVKLPIAVLVALLATVGVVVGGRRTICSFPEARRWVPWLTVVAVFLVFSMLSNTNLGVRHMMPVIALGLLPVAVVVSRSRTGSAMLVGALALESVLLTPLWMSATNTWWLGGRNPTRFVFSAGNLEYRQDFLELARQTKRRGITRLGVLYPVLENEIVTAWVPGGFAVDPTKPLEPGWYAVSVLLEQYLPAIRRASPESLRGYPNYIALAERWEPAWRAVRSGEDHGYVAGSFHLYRLTDSRSTAHPSPPAGAVP